MKYPNILFSGCYLVYGDFINFEKKNRQLVYAFILKGFAYKVICIKKIEKTLYPWTT